MKINLIKNTTSNDYQGVSWIYKNDDVVLGFPYEIHAIYSSK